MKKLFTFFLSLMLPTLALAQVNDPIESKKANQCYHEAMRQQKHESIHQFMYPEKHPNFAHYIKINSDGLPLSERPLSYCIPVSYRMNAQVNHIEYIGQKHIVLNTHLNEQLMQQAYNPQGNTAMKGTLILGAASVIGTTIANTNDNKADNIQAGSIIAGNLIGHVAGQQKAKEINLALKNNSDYANKYRIHFTILDGKYKNRQGYFEQFDFNLKTTKVKNNSIIQLEKVSTQINDYNYTVIQ